MISLAIVHISTYQANNLLYSPAIQALSRALLDIADALCDVEASRAAKSLIKEFEDAVPDPHAWLESAASSEAICRIAGEMPERICQLLVDWIDAVCHRVR